MTISTRWPPGCASLQRPDLLIAIGGGSCLDMGKALAVLLSNPGKGIDYRGFDKVRVPGVPTLLIPTTAGTGSEVTINAVFTDKREMRKLGINGRYLSATWALLDAEWTLSCPSAAAVSAGMDAMVHTLESFMCRQHNALTRVFSREAFRLLYRDLPCLVEEPGNHRAPPESAARGVSGRRGALQFGIRHRRRVLLSARRELQDSPRHLRRGIS